MNEKRTLFKKLKIGGGIIVAVIATSALVTENLGVIKRNVINFLDESQGISFDIKTNESRFVVLGTMSGKAYVEKSFLRLKISESTLRTQQNGPGVLIDYVRLGLAYSRSAIPNWDTAAWSNKKEIKQFVESFSTISVDPFERRIPIDGVKNSGCYWLVLQIVLSDGSATFMHSQPINLS